MAYGHRSSPRIPGFYAENSRWRDRASGATVAQSGIQEPQGSICGQVDRLHSHQNTDKRNGFEQEFNLRSPQLWMTL